MLIFRLFGCTRTNCSDRSETSQYPTGKTQTLLYGTPMPFWEPLTLGVMGDLIDSISIVLILGVRGNNVNVYV